jgi:hypothetical protein
MNAIEKIKAKLSAYSDVQYSEGPDQIEVHPRNRSGFTVGLRIARPGFTVYFEGWHEEFTSEDEALNCFAFGLSPKCRLAVVLRGNTETKWVVESLENGHWKADSVTGLLLQPFWRSARAGSSTVRIACSMPAIPRSRELD